MTCPRAPSCYVAEQGFNALLLLFTWPSCLPVFSQSCSRMTVKKWIGPDSDGEF